MAYSSIGEIDSNNTKLLILDEFDAPLNPTLTKILFEVLKIYFLDKDIAVILITHSPASIAMAPDNTVFYEMFKLSSVVDNASRIQKVDRDDYADMKLALDKYFSEINQNKERLIELDERNKHLQALINVQADPSKVHVISEGNNIDHLKKAVSVLAPALIPNIDFIAGAKDRTGSTQLKSAFEISSKSQSADKYIFVWDVDAEPMLKNLNSTPTHIAFCFKANTANTVSVDKDGKPAGIENLYDDSLFTTDVYVTIQKRGPYGGEIEITEFDKQKFLEKISSLTDETIFAKFRPLIKKIEQLL